ncbi:hypothetical protein [Geoalkalibacter halelectricus]|uniref:Uncharacterized protein n=1 Tax=Geoalkalibacter halelectricus TaxID=2847045 RepID=A0ABY5ZPA9_9BACT|nr:hypothetical protein [Geoalkalibacter halelectricus]MDO3377065.1 hypothetical protein [Geoalkalibacter halelectricus]MDO3377130.1 hypothetical protein [Geoalkalibacter halelectricus]UWZ79720.1 hypothetical protein L9S41_18875 [Geoalkalibacter halelectricus]
MTTVKELFKGGHGRTTKETQDDTGHPSQTPPPLSLPSPWHVTAPVTGVRTMRDGLGDFGDRGAKPAPVADRFQTMNRPTAGTAQTPQQNRL